MRRTTLATTPRRQHLLVFVYACADATTLPADLLPSSPSNVSVRWRGTSLLVSWSPPAARRSPVTVGCYLVEYRTLGHWVPLVERVAASERPSYRWTTASRSATYQFRVFSVAAPCRPDVPPRRSRPSAIVSFHTSGPVLDPTAGVFGRPLHVQ